MNSLNKLIPPAVECSVGNETFTIKPLRIGQLPAFLRAISPVMQALSHPSIDWFAVFGEHGDDVLAALAIALGKPRSWIDDLGADDAIFLASKVIEVNADFFTQAVIPKLGLVFGEVEQLVPTAMPTSGSTPPSA